VNAWQGHTRRCRARRVSNPTAHVASIAALPDVHAQPISPFRWARSALAVHRHHFKDTLEHFLGRRAGRFGQARHAHRHRAAPDAADPGAQQQLLPQRHGREELHAGHGGHHRFALRQAACREKRGLGHQPQAFASEQRATVVGVRGQHQLVQFQGSRRACHASQFTQNSGFCPALKRRNLANRNP